MKFMLEWKMIHLIRISFSGRGKHNNQGRKINPSYEELCNIVKYAHTYHVEVNFTANTILGVGKNGMAPLFYNYVKAAITTGIDRIIIGDLGNIIFLREKGIEMPMVGSVFFISYECGNHKFLQEIWCESNCTSTSYDHRRN